MPRHPESYVICLLAAALISATAVADTAPSDPDGQTAYLTHCGACHLENGQGVPSAFPPLDERLGRWAATETGRDYLVSAVSNGLLGLIQVHGIQYAGAMPQMKHIDDGEIAAALTYAVQMFGSSVEAAPFTAGELASRRVRLGNVQSRTLRPAD